MSHFLARVVELCIFKLVNGEPRYLVMRRSEGEKIYPGAWQIVSGSTEENEHAGLAALRELREETKLEPRRFWVVPLVDTFYSAVSDEIYNCPVFAAEVDAISEPNLSAEHEAHRWVGLREAMELLVWPGQKAIVQAVHEHITRPTDAGRWLEIKDVHSLKKEPWI
jgi:dATP pyrophosphohydrolase